MKYHTESVKQSSAVLANCTLCQRRRHVRIRVLSKFHFRYTNITSHSVKTARNNGNLSLSRREQQLANSIVSIMSRHLDAAATT